MHGHFLCWILLIAATLHNPAFAVNGTERRADKEKGTRMETDQYLAEQGAQSSDNGGNNQQQSHNRRLAPSRQTESQHPLSRMAPPPPSTTQRQNKGELYDSLFYEADAIGDNYFQPQTAAGGDHQNQSSTMNDDDDSFDSDTLKAIALSLKSLEAERRIEQQSKLNTENIHKNDKIDKDDQQQQLATSDDDDPVMELTKHLSLQELSATNDRTYELAKQLSKKERQSQQNDPHSLADNANNIQNALKDLDGDEAEVVQLMLIKTVDATRKLNRLSPERQAKVRAAYERAINPHGAESSMASERRSTEVSPNQRSHAHGAESSMAGERRSTEVSPNQRPSNQQTDSNKWLQRQIAEQTTYGHHQMSSDDDNSEDEQNKIFPIGSAGEQFSDEPHDDNNPGRLREHWGSRINSDKNANEYYSQGRRTSMTRSNKKRTSASNSPQAGLTIRSPPRISPGSSSSRQLSTSAPAMGEAMLAGESQREHFHNAMMSSLEKLKEHDLKQMTTEELHELRRQVERQRLKQKMSQNNDKNIRFREMGRRVQTGQQFVKRVDALRVERKNKDTDNTNNSNVDQSSDNSDNKIRRRRGHFDRNLNEGTESD